MASDKFTMNVFNLRMTSVHQRLWLFLLLVQLTRVAVNGAAPAKETPRDPTVAGGGLQEALLATAPPGSIPGYSIGSRLIKLDVRGLGTNSTPAEAEAYLKAKPADRVLRSIEVTSTPFIEAARALSKVTGLNVAPSAGSASNFVTIFLTDVPALTALETLCNAHNLWLKLDEVSGIYRVYTVSEFRRDLASFREEKTEIFTLLYPNAFDIANAIADLYGERVEVNLGDYDDALSLELQQRLARFDALNNRAMGIGVSSLTGSGGSIGGSSGGAMMGGGGSRRGPSAGNRPLIPLTQVLQQQQQLGQALSADQVQALTEAQAQGDTNAAATVVHNATGRRITIHVTILRRQNKLLIRTADESAMLEIKEIVKRLDLPTAMVMLEVKVLRVQLGDGLNSAFDYAWSRGGAKGEIGGSFSRGAILPVNPTLGTPTGSGFATDSFVAQYFGENVRARMELLESKNRLSAVASPVLLTANNEVSRIFVGEEVPITRGFTGGSIVIGTGGAPIAQSPNVDIEFRPVGTTLLLTPNINADRTVTIRLVQENSSLNKGGGEIPVPSAGGGFQKQAVDTIQSRTVSGTIVARDNEAVVVGGLIEDVISKKRTGIPFISRIPVLGAPFRKDDNSSSRNELVLIITPYIMNTPAEGEGISRQVAERLSLHPEAQNFGKGWNKPYGTNDVPQGRQAPREIKPK